MSYRYDLTPAAQRALAAASGWTNYEGDTGLDLAQLLLGLLAEPECRAAIMLAKQGIEPAMVQARWPDLQRAADAKHAVSGLHPPQHSDRLQNAFHTVAARLSEHPQPLMLGTEHLLLGLLMAGEEVSDWLQDQGLSADCLADEIGRMHGIVPGPLEFEEHAEQLVPSTDRRCDLRPVLDTPTQQQPSTGRVAQAASSAGLYRTIDAAANRAREGLRVVEDFARFQLDDCHLTGRLKVVRHRLTELLARIPHQRLYAARDTQGDVGTQISTPGESLRAEASAVVVANFKRLEESLRSLEEYSKLLDTDLASSLQQLRYEVYTLERALVVTARSMESLAQSRLYVLIDGRPSLSAFEALASSLIKAGVDMLQLRDKRLADRELLQRARTLRQLLLELPSGGRPFFIMNDRADLALLAQADGVHLGQEELTVKDARAIVGPEMLIGISTHSINQARQAVLDGANYLGVGPTFRSATKQFEEFPGLDLVRQVAAEIRLPAFAIGGINADNLDQVLEAGLCRVALHGAIGNASDPAQVARELKARLKAAR